MVVAGQDLVGGNKTNVLRADAARNRVEVLRIARQQLADGDTSLPMNVIARLANVGVGTVYRHFPTRRALLEALAEPSLEQLIIQANRAAALADPQKAFSLLLRSAVEGQLGDIALAAVLANPEFECIETLRLAEELHQAVNQVLDRARRAGILRRDLSADDLRRLLSGVVQAVQAGEVHGDEAGRYIKVLLAGLRPS